MNMKHMEIFRVSLREVYFYTPGTYKALFEIKCKQRKLPFRVKPENNFEKTANEAFVLASWHQHAKRIEPVELRGNELDMVIDRSVFTDPTYLYVTILKHDPDKPTSSQLEEFHTFANGKLLLKPKRELFPATELDEVMHRGSIKLSTLLENEQISVAAGYMKYVMENHNMNESGEDITADNITYGNVEVLSNYSSEHASISRFSSCRVTSNNVVNNNLKECISFSHSGFPSKESMSLEKSKYRYQDVPESREKEFKSDLATTLIELGEGLNGCNENNTQRDERIYLPYTPMKYKLEKAPGSLATKLSSTHMKQTECIPRFEKFKECIAFKRSNKLQGTPPSKDSKNNLLTLRIPSDTDFKEFFWTSPDGKKSPNSEVIVDLAVVKSEEMPLFVKRKLHVTKPSPNKESTLVKEIKPFVDDFKKEDIEVNTTPHPVVTFHESDTNNDNSSVQKMFACASPLLTGIDFKTTFPDMNAIQMMLPKYHALTKGCKKETDVVPHNPIQEPESQISSRGTTRSSCQPTDLSLAEKQNLDSHVTAVLDYQAKELDRYKHVIQTMGEDMIGLRREISKLQHEKSQLTTKLYYAGDGLSEDAGGDLEVIVPLKRQLAVENDKKNMLQERVYKLQNEIIKKNEIEACYLELQDAHVVQQEKLQQLQTKIKKYKLLENTCHSQERVIEELEKRLNGSSNNRNAKKEDKNVKKSSLKAVTFDENANILKASVFEIDEKLRLIEKLEQAEGTIRALEEQIHINTKQWARDRAMAQESFGVRALSRRSIAMPPMGLYHTPTSYDRRDYDRPGLSRYAYERPRDSQFGR